jgi:hypothetical protein
VKRGFVAYNYGTSYRAGGKGLYGNVVVVDVDDVVGFL